MQRGNHRGRGDWNGPPRGRGNRGGWNDRGRRRGRGGWNDRGRGHRGRGWRGRGRGGPWRGRGRGRGGWGPPRGNFGPPRGYGGPNRGFGPRGGFRGGRGNRGRPHQGHMQPPQQNQQKPEKFGDWLVWRAADGRPYYQNLTTKEVTWTRPPQVPDYVERPPPQRMPPPGPGPAGPGPMGPGPGPGPMPGPGPFNPHHANPNFPNPNGPNVQKQMERENWVEYKTSDQVSFYCNIRTGKTTFKRPPELDLPKSELLGSEEPEPQKIDITKLEANKKRDTIQFKEIQTVVKPKEKTSWVHVAKQEVEASINGETIAKKKPPPITAEESSYANQEERVVAFKALLKDQGLTVKDKWETFLRKIIKDQRYQAIKTLKERKAVFTTYQDEIAEAKHQSRKEAKRKLKQDYMDLLKECDAVKPGKRYKQFRSAIEKDPRCKAIRSIDDRERWAMDYINELERKEEEKKNDAKKALKEALTAHKFSHQSTWRECEKEFSDHDAFNTRNLNIKEKKEVFQDIINDLRRAKEKEERRKREEKRAKEHKEENDFIDLLKEHSQREKPLFHSKTPWSDYSALDEVKNDPRFTIFKDEKKAIPYKRFEKFCWKLDADLKNDKKALKRIFRKKDFIVKAEHEILSLYEEVSKLTKEANIKETHLKLLLLEMIAKAKFKEEQEAKKREKEKEREREREREREKQKEREKKRAKEKEKSKKKDSSRSSKEGKEKKKKKRKRERDEESESSRKKRKKEKKPKKRKDEKSPRNRSRRHDSKRSDSKDETSPRESKRDKTMDVEKDRSAEKAEADSKLDSNEMEVETKIEQKKRTVEIMDAESAEPEQDETTKESEVDSDKQEMEVEPPKEPMKEAEVEPKEAMEVEGEAEVEAQDTEQKETVSASPEVSENQQTESSKKELTESPKEDET